MAIQIETAGNGVLFNGALTDKQGWVLSASSDQTKVVLTNRITGLSSSSAVAEVEVDGSTFADYDALVAALGSVLFKSSGTGSDGVQSVNGDTGPDVVLDAGDIGAATAAQGLLADTAVQPDDLDDYYTKTESDGLLDEKISIGGIEISDFDVTADNQPIIVSYESGTWTTRRLRGNPEGGSIVLRGSTGTISASEATNNEHAVNLGQLNKVVQVTANKTLALTENLSFQNVTAASTITIPTNASVAFPIGAEITVALESGTATIAAASGVTTISLNNNLALDTVGQVAVLKKTGTDTWFVEINGGS